MALHPDFPVVEGDYRMTDEWSLTLPVPFNRRIEDGSLVVWRPGLTFWIAVWGNDHDETADERVRWILDAASPGRVQQRIDRQGGLVRLTYEMLDEDPDREPSVYPSIAGYVLSDRGHVQISAYCDDAAAWSLAHDVIRSVRPVAAESEEPR
jgi:hypothetical protein